MRSEFEVVSVRFSMLETNMLRDLQPRFTLIP
jgi:hypothetical protein